MSVPRARVQDAALCFRSSRWTSGPTGSLQHHMVKTQIKTLQGLAPLTQVVEEGCIWGWELVKWQLAWPCLRWSGQWGVWGLTRPPSALASPRPPPGASSPRPGSSGSQCHTHVHCCKPAGLLRWAVRVEPVCRRRCDLVRALSLLPGGRSIHLRGARLRAQPGNHGHWPESPELPGKQEAQGNSGESPPSFSIHTDCRSGGARHCPRLL